jgi:DNA-binding NtrC family response regulator
MKKNILLVEYCSGTIDTLKELLHPKIFDITVAGNEEVAKVLLNKIRFDMLITETLLPKSHGFILSKYVSENYPRTKIIIISEKLKKVDYKQDAITKYGAIDFFEKPLNTKKLKKVIFKALDISKNDLLGIEDTTGVTTNIHVLPDLKKIKSEKGRDTEKDNSGEGLEYEDVDKNSQYKIELD